MKVLFCLPHGGLFRNFESTLRLLVERGHSVHVAFDRDRYRSAAFERLCAEAAELTAGYSPGVPPDRWCKLAEGVRGGSDYLRYLDPEYADAPKLRARAAKDVPIRFAPIVGVARRGGPGARARVDSAFRAVERSLPVRDAALEYLDQQAPDVLVVSPLLGSRVQLELLRAARLRGVPSALCVASWDSLTSKGLIRCVPDVVLAWNELQRQEAAGMHRVPDDRIVITGAPSFDEWFSRGPSTTHTEFCKRLGLDEDQPIVTFLGSSGFVSPRETPWVGRWLRHLRAQSPRLRRVGVIIRPHPQNARQYADVDFSEDRQAVVWPPPEDAPQITGLADWSYEDFYDSVHHARAVVAVNTTAMIESAVIGRPVFTLLDPEFDDGQRRALHFQQLLGSGLLRVAHEFGPHFAELDEALEHDRRDDDGKRRFLETFLRPYGLDRPATPFLVDAIEAVPEHRCPEPVQPNGEVPKPVLDALSAFTAFASPRRDGPHPVKRLASYLDEAADALEHVADEAAPGGARSRP